MKCIPRYTTVIAVLGVSAGLLLPGCPPEDGLKMPERARITQLEVDEGIYSVFDLITLGRELNLHAFKREDGFGNGRGGRIPPNFSRLDGPDSASCNSCHGLGDVVMGWGTNAGNVLVALDDPTNPTVAGSNERNTTMVHGAAWLELLSRELSSDLQAQRAQARSDARTLEESRTIALESQGIQFGSLTVAPDGTVDTTELVGVDPDLRIRPFHAKGHEASIRIFTRGALNRHHGIQSWDLLKFTDPEQPTSSWDEDQDGVIDELNEAELTAMTLHQVGLPAPVESEQENAQVEQGRALMATLGCTVCHVPTLRVSDPRWQDRSSTGTQITVDLTDPALGLPRLKKEADGSVLVPLWGDLKRHDVGEYGHEPLDQPVDPSLPWWDGGERGERITETLPPIRRELMLTTELWGVADTGPWWHDGSAATIEEAILMHGGEAQTARDAYADASDEDQAALLAFLGQLRIGVVAEPSLVKQTPSGK